MTCLVDGSAWCGPTEITPVIVGSTGYRRGQDMAGIWIKRDDVASIGGMRGGKVRTCLALARGATGLITAGSRHSPQVAIVAAVARVLGIPCRVHVPRGTISPVVQWAVDQGAELVQHYPGYNTVIKARAASDAFLTGWRLIPFGMQCQEAVEQTRRQAANLLPSSAIDRIVVAVGSGMSLAGIVAGTMDMRPRPKILGVVVGADPRKRLDHYAPGWRDRVTLEPAGVDYSNCVEAKVWGAFGEDIDLDPYYEAKCLPFLRFADLFWIVGHRQPFTNGQICS